MKNILHEEFLNICSRLHRRSGVVSVPQPEQVTVSLTSYPPRFKRLPIVLESLLRQSIRPVRVYLCIAENDMAALPKRILSLQAHGVEIDSYRDIRSYKKIIPCLHKYPGSTIVTADDDVIYPKDWLKSLWDAHLAHPQEVICHRARLITLSKTGKINPYRQWPNLKQELASSHVFPVGVGGVLYPPQCFDSRVYDEERFMQLSPYGDDIWLKSMTLLQDVSCRKIAVYTKNFQELRHSQKTALRTVNVRSRNDQQIEKVFSEFHLGSQLIEDSEARNTGGPM